MAGTLFCTTAQQVHWKGRCSSVHSCPAPRDLGHLLTAWESTQAVLCPQTETSPGSPVAQTFFMVVVKRKACFLAQPGSYQHLQVSNISCSASLQTWKREQLHRTTFAQCFQLATSTGLSTCWYKVLLSMLFSSEFQNLVLNFQAFAFIYTRCLPGIVCKCLHHDLNSTLLQEWGETPEISKKL